VLEKKRRDERNLRERHVDNPNMHALVAPTPYATLDATFARLLSTDRRRMARALTQPANAAAGPGRQGPWGAGEIILLAAFGFFLASLVLSVAFA
jgi:hypothetical protein